MNDHACKRWLKPRRPLWQTLLACCTARRAHGRRSAAGFDPLKRGVQFRAEDGLLYITPVPAQHR